jgi:hypothetical protein
MIHIPPQRFPLGRLRITRKAQAVLDLTKESAWAYLFRHGARPEDAEEEEVSDGPVVSTFTTVSRRQIVVRTEADRSQTLIMLPEEYE